MNRLLSIPALMMISASAVAQTTCSTSNALFKFDNVGTPKEISTLGSAPEFPFLRNLSSPAKVYSAIKRNYSEHSTGYNELNDLLMAAGLTNGVDDLHADNITAFYIPSGTEGNMGSSGYTTGYYRLSGDAGNLKHGRYPATTAAMCTSWLNSAMHSSPNRATELPVSQPPCS